MRRLASCTSVCAFGLWLVAGVAPAKNKPDACQPHTKAGDVCTVQINELHPTQFSYGAIEVDQRAAKIDDMSEKKREKYVEKHVIPIVIGPDGVLYVTNHHHFALAYATAIGWHARVLATVQENWRSLSPVAFWRAMENAGLVYLYDERGQGPLTPAALPSSLNGLSNDPYRSLAWGVSNAGGYDETDAPYADFLWANYFRSRVAASLIADDFDRAVARGVEAARDPAARDLPGFKSQGHHNSF